MIKCGTCTNFNMMQKKGKLKTSKACYSWTPNWKLLSPDLRKVARYISKLDAHSLKIFDLHFQKKRIPLAISLMTNQKCGECLALTTCKNAPNVEDSPYTHDCKRWNLDLDKNISDEQCQKELRLLVKAVSNITDPEDHFYLKQIIKEQKSIGPKKPVKVFIGDTVLYKAGAKTYDCKVIKLTPENVIISNGVLKITLLYRTLLTSNVENIFEPNLKGELNV